MTREIPPAARPEPTRPHDCGESMRCTQSDGSFFSGLLSDGARPDARNPKPMNCSIDCGCCTHSDCKRWKDCDDNDRSSETEAMNAGVERQRPAQELRRVRRHEGSLIPM